MRNTNTAPVNGSCCKDCLQSWTSPSMPLRKSTASTATGIFICGVICNITPHSKSRGSRNCDRSTPGPARRGSSGGRAASRPARSRIPAGIHTPMAKRWAMAKRAATKAARAAAKARRTPPACAGRRNGRRNGTTIPPVASASSNRGPAPTPCDANHERSQVRSPPSTAAPQIREPAVRLCRQPANRRPARRKSAGTLPSFLLAIAVPSRIENSQASKSARGIHTGLPEGHRK